MNLKVNDMETGKIIYVDGNNEYLKGLIKILREFVVEEVCNASFSEIRLNNKINSLRQLYDKERRMLSENPTVPKFGSNFSGYEILFTKCNDTKFEA